MKELSDRAMCWRGASVISMTFGLLFLLSVLDSVRVITSPEFQRMHNQAHFYIFQSAIAAALLLLCVAFAFAARKHSRAGKRKL